MHIVFVLVALHYKGRSFAPFNFFNIAMVWFNQLWFLAAVQFWEICHKGKVIPMRLLPVFRSGPAVEPPGADSRGRALQHGALPRATPHWRYTTLYDSFMDKSSFFYDIRSIILGFEPAISFKLENCFRPNRCTQRPSTKLLSIT